MISYKYQTWQWCRCCKEFQLYICRQWQKALNRPWSVPAFRRRDIAILLVLTLHYGNQERPNLKLSDNFEVSENFFSYQFIAWDLMLENLHKSYNLFITHYSTSVLWFSGIRKTTYDVQKKRIYLRIYTFHFIFFCRTNMV